MCATMRDLADALNDIYHNDADEQFRKIIDGINDNDFVIITDSPFVVNKIVTSDGVLKPGTLDNNDLLKNLKEESILNYTAEPLVTSAKNYKHFLNFNKPKVVELLIEKQKTSVFEMLRLDKADLAAHHAMNELITTTSNHEKEILIALRQSAFSPFQLDVDNEVTNKMKQ